MRKLSVLLSLIPLSFNLTFLSAQDKPLSVELDKGLNYEEIDSIVYLYYEQGKFEHAIPYVKLGREKAKEEFGPKSSEYGVFTSDLGFFYNRIGKYEVAEPLFLEEMAITKELLGEEHEDYAASLNNLATLYRNTGKYDQALLMFIKSKVLREKTIGTNHPDYAIALNNLAAQYRSMGQFDKAEPLYLKAKNLREKTLGIEDPKYASTLNNLALFYKQMGRYELALPLYIEAIKITKKTLGEKHPDHSNSVSNLANLYNIMGHYKKAEVLFLEAENIVKNSLGADHPQYIVALNNLASLYKNMGNFDAALPLYKKIKELFFKSKDKKHISYASFLINFAQFYQNKGEYDLALPLYLEATGIYRVALGPQHPNYASTLNSLAQLYFDMNESSMCLETLSKTIFVSSKEVFEGSITASKMKLFSEITYPSKQHLEQMIFSLEILYQLTLKSPPKTKKAELILIADLALDLLKKQRDGHTGHKDKLRMLAQSNNWTIRNLSILNKEKQINKAFKLVEQNKGVLLMDAFRAEKAYQIGNLPDSIVWKQEHWMKRKDKIQARLIEKGNAQSKLQNALNEANQELESLDKLIKADYPKYFKLKHEESFVDLEMVQELLDEKTALLNYVLTDSMAYIFYVDKHQTHWIEQQLDYKLLNRRIRKLHAVLSNYGLIMNNEDQSYQIYTEQSHWFYKNLVEPALVNAKGIEHLVIISDRELGHLPFEAFLVKQAPQETTKYAELHYLLEDYMISYDYSAALWKENKESQQSTNNGTVLGMASDYTPIMDSIIKQQRAPYYRDQRSDLIPLPSALKEVGFLSTQMDGSFIIGKRATERAFKAAAKDCGIIHLAMHGLLDHNNSMLSSLVFTEDGDTLEDNFLQAYEISKLELNADLVVLSACETGFGKFETGNGIASLARAFMYAGVPSMVVTLWQVNDFATAEIMKHFYHEISKGVSKGEALRQAKLTYIKNKNVFGEHPALWSPFILIGNTAPVYLGTNCIPWVIGLLAGGIGLLILLLRYRKNKIEA